MHVSRFTGPVFLDFIKRLIAGNHGRKVVLIIDAPHRARIVREYVRPTPILRTKTNTDEPEWLAGRRNVPGH